MRKPNIQLCYLHEGKDFEFLLDVGNSNDRRRLLSTIEWAARNNVEIAILPIQNDEAKTDNIRAIA